MAALPFVADGYYLQLASTALVAAMLALSLQLLVGGTGLVSLGHAAFFGIGAYTVRFLGLAGARLGPGITAGGRAPRGPRGAGRRCARPAHSRLLLPDDDARLRADAVLPLPRHPLGGGADGVFLARPTFSAFGFDYAPRRRDLPAAMLYANLAVLVAMYGGLALLLRTLFGRALLGISANEHRMRALGFDTYGLKLGPSPWPARWRASPATCSP